MSEQTVAWVTRAASAIGAVEAGRPLADHPGRDEQQGAGSPTTRQESTASSPSHLRSAGPVDAHLDRARAALEAAEALTQLAARVDAALVVAVREQTAAIGRSLLAEKGASSPAELSATGQRRWRARAKSLTRHEIEAATGWAPGEVIDLVGVATAPAAVSTTAVAAMATGGAPWRLVRSLWRDCGGLAPDDAAHVTAALLGDRADEVVPERLTPDGEVATDPWQHKEFRAALARETTRIRSRDAAAARITRAQALAGRGMSVTIVDDGTAVVSLVGSATQAAAVADRLDRAARAARQAGDPRPLRQLRTDIGYTLLLHGTVQPTAVRSQIPAAQGGQTADLTGSCVGPVLESRDDPTAISVEWTPQLQQAATGMPAATLHVVVPVTALTHGVNGAETRPRMTGTVDPPPSRVSAPRRPIDTPPHPDDEPAHSVDPPPSSLGEPSLPVDPPPHSLGEPPAHPIQETADSSESLPVGRTLGAHSMFLPLDEIHALAVAPGTTLSRLLTDPADGRLVERTLTTYRPDARMRAQILAADVTCRGRGCTVDAGRCQLDHVEEFATPGGVTAETNLVPLHVGHHHPKTLKAWDAELAANRDLTWTSLLGRIYRTRAHDYRQYVTLVGEAIDRVHEARLSASDDRPGGPASEDLDPVDDLINQEIYLALSLRERHEPLRAGDDHREPDTLRYGGWASVTLTHTDSWGDRRTGPSPDALDQARSRLATTAAPDGADEGPLAQNAEWDDRRDGGDDDRPPF